MRNQNHRIAAIALLAGALAASSAAQDTKYPPTGQQIPPPGCLTLGRPWEGPYTPCTDTTHQQWLTDVTHWRMERRIRIGYDDAQYRIPELQWAQSSFIQPQMMVHDRYFYDPVAHKYTVDRYLDDLTKRETIESVRRAVLSLPTVYREAIVLCDLQDTSYEDAAQVLDCPIGTVRSRLNRGRSMLASKLAVKV